MIKVLQVRQDMCRKFRDFLKSHRQSHAISVQLSVIPWTNYEALSKSNTEVAIWHTYVESWEYLEYELFMNTKTYLPS